MHHFGGTVLASNELTSEHFAMPQATIGRESVIDQIVPLGDIAAVLVPSAPHPGEPRKPTHEPDELVRGLEAAARGESPLAPKAAQALVAARAAEQNDPELTPRELEVLALLADGLPNKLIARRLEISEKTVKAHLTNIFQRIGVTDRTQAALWAHRHMSSRS